MLAFAIYSVQLMVEHVTKRAVGHDCDHLIDAYCGSGDCFWINYFLLIPPFSTIDTLSYQFPQDYLVWAVLKHSLKCTGLKWASSLLRLQRLMLLATTSQIVNLCVASAKRYLARFRSPRFECLSRHHLFSFHNRIDFFPHQVSHFPRDQTVVILDPPRKGCDDVFLRQLFDFRPKKIVYVSCDPATQARDAQAICAAGYNITDITPFDLFPQTRHIENVMVFLRWHIVSHWLLWDRTT